MVRILDYLLGLVIVGVGILHSFVVAPGLSATLSEDVFWFFAAGLAVILTGALNLLRAAYGGQLPALRWSAGLASAVLFAVLVFYALAFDAAGEPVVVLQILAYTLLVAMAVFRRG